MSESSPRGRWVAIATGVISVLLALAYLALVMVLDRQGPLRLSLIHISEPTRPY